MIARIASSCIGFMLLTGCQSERQTTTLTGTVTYKGAPILFGAVYFHSPDNQVAMGVIREDGTYIATDVPVGEVRVSFQVKDPGGMYGRATADGNAANANAVTSLPPQYADPNNSGLSYTITRSTKTLDIKIE